MNETVLDSAPRTLSQRRLLYWSVRRELWEHRAVYLAPAVIAVVALIGTGHFLSHFYMLCLPHRRAGQGRCADPGDAGGDPRAGGRGPGPVAALEQSHRGGERSVADPALEPNRSHRHVGGAAVRPGGQFAVAGAALRLDPAGLGLGAAGADPLGACTFRHPDYACHEGNYSLPNALSGARVQEAEAATTPR